MHFAAGYLRKRLKGRNLRVRSGAAALEFAMVGPIFIFFICVCFDLSLLLFTQSVLNNAARDAARLIETNQGGGASAFKTKLCADMQGLVPCASLQYYVQSAATFGAMSAGVVTNANGLKNNGTFSPGTPGEDVVVQVAYNRPTLLPWVLRYINGTAVTDSKASELLVSTIAFQNEP